MQATLMNQTGFWGRDVVFPWGKPSKSKFAAELSKAIGDVTGGRVYKYDAENFRLLCEDGDGEVNLSNMYQEHCALPRAERPGNLLRLASVFGSSVEDLPATFEEAKSNLRPKIWSRAGFESMELQRQLEGGKVPDLPLYPLGSHLYSSLVYDTENAMRSVSSEDLEQWNTTYYQALEVACERLDETTMAMVRIGDGFHSSASGDNYDSSRILLVGRREFDVDGEHIGIVSHRDVMYVAGSNDEVSLKIMFEMTATDMEEQPRPLSPLPLRFVDGQWEDWAPPQNHVLRHLYDDLELRFLAGLYTDQKQLLDAVFNKRAMDLFVASFSAIREEDSERLYSYSVWSRGVDSLLPRTQYIVLVDESGVLASGEWEHVRELTDGLLVEDDSYYPIRYRVKTFPTEEQIAAIGTAEPFRNQNE